MNEGTCGDIGCAFMAKFMVISLSRDIQQKKKKRKEKTANQQNHTHYIAALSVCYWNLRMYSYKSKLFQGIFIKKVHKQ